MFCQDSGIALKIFELALKRYGMQADCVWEYINYMSRLNGKMLCRLVFEPHLWLFIVFPVLVYFTAVGWLPTLRLSQSTWAVSPPKIGSYHPHPPSPLLL